MNTRTDAAPPHAEFFPALASPGPISRWSAVLREDRAQLTRFWPVIRNMVVQDLRVKYQRSVLGFFWTLLNPILMMITLTAVFSQLMGQNWKEYACYLFAGLVPWALLASSLNDCAFCIIGNEGLIRKIYIPKLVFPLTRLLINLTTFILSLVALFLFLIPLGAHASAPMLVLPLVVVLYSAFVLGLGLIVATMNTFYRDCSHLVMVFLQALYFATPIMYEAKDFTRWKWLTDYNPIFAFLHLFQEIIRYSRWPSAGSFLAAAGIAAASLGVGYVAFKLNEDKFVFRL